MLGVLFVSFFQAVSGAPSDLPAAPPAATTTTATPSGAAATPPANAAPAAPEEPLRCRNMQVTGTRFVRRVCMTKAQEDAWRTDSRRWLEHSQSQMPTKGG